MSKDEAIDEGIIFSILVIVLEKNPTNQNPEAMMFCFQKKTK